MLFILKTISGDDREGVWIVLGLQASKDMKGRTIEVKVMEGGLLVLYTFERRSGDCPVELVINPAFTPDDQAASIGLVGTEDIKEGDAW